MASEAHRIAPNTTRGLASYLNSRATKNLRKSPSSIQEGTRHKAKRKFGKNRARGKLDQLETPRSSK